MSQLLPYVDVCIANEEDAKDVFGIEAEGTDVNSGKLNRDGYISVARQLSSRFGCKYVAITLRSSISANDNDWPVCSMKPRQTRRTSPPHTMCTLSTASAAAIPLAAV